MATMTKRSEEGVKFLADMLKCTIHGQCYYFALALHRGLEWTLVGLMEGETVVHAGVRSPEGKFWDGRGEISVDEFVRPFTRDDSWVISEVTEVMLVRKIVQEHLVEYFQKKAQGVWPELPWKTTSCQEQISSFADELEALSRKHGLWIYGSIPTMLPMVAEGYGDEAGYEITMQANGDSYTINRVFR